MALTLAEAQKRFQNPLERAIVKTFLDESPIVRNTVIRNIQGNALKFNRENTLPTAAFRAVNASVAASNQAVDQVTVDLKILASLLQVDTFLDATTPDLRDQELLAQIKSLVLDANKAMFKGDAGTNPLEFNGLQVQTAALSQEVDNGGGVLSLSKLREAVIKCKGTGKAVYMNQDLYIAVQNAAEDPSISTIRVGKDQFGADVPMIAGAPIYMAGEDTTGVQVLPFTEEVAGTNTSIYVVAHGNGFTLLQNGDLRTREVADPFARKWAFEWFLAPTVWEKRGVVRLKKIIAGAAVK